MSQYQADQISGDLEGWAVVPFAIFVAVCAFVMAKGVFELAEQTCRGCKTWNSQNPELPPEQQPTAGEDLAGRVYRFERAEGAPRNPQAADV